jgi:hypothetical protein
MPDWQEFVRRKLSGIALEEAESAQVTEELAVHLEEQYQALLHEGISEQTAVHCIEQQIIDWHDLKSEIESSRGKVQPMTQRVSQFWFPGFMTILLASIFFRAFQAFGPSPWVSPTWGGRLRTVPVAVLYFPWLATLPFVGGLGAYLSHRAGARPWVVFSSVMFPTFPYLVFLIIGLPLAVILDGHIAHNIMLPAFFVGFCAWVLLPALALLAGGLPVHYFSRKTLA